MSGSENILGLILHLLVEVVLSYLSILCQFFVPKKPKSLDRDIALVTGAGRGIGREICLQLSRKKVKKIVGWDINPDLLEETRDIVVKEGGDFVGFVCDVTDKKQISRVSQKVRSEVGDITILVNNAGIMPAKPFLDFTTEEIEQVFRVNTFSQIYTLMEFLPDFYQNNHGHVVSMCSVAGVSGTAYLTAYCASKFAIKGLMDTLFLEQRKDRPNSNVKLTTVLPFTINTGLAVEPTTTFPSLIPICEPEECARLVVEGIQLEEETLFVPRRLKAFFGIQRAFPRRIQLAVFDLLNCGVGYNRKETKQN